MKKTVYARCLVALVLSLTGSLSLAQTIDGGRGELPLTVPSSYDPSDPAPLVVLLHGYGSSGERQDDYMGFSALAERYGYLFLAPDGRQESGGNNARYWSASRACCNFFNSSDDDTSYIYNLIDLVKADYSIDPDRVYLIGHSNGGFMSYRMAYEFPDVFAAIASLAGAEATEAGPAPAAPVHVLQIHGTQDGTIAYEGADIRGNVYPGAVETVERWAGYNNCDISGAEIARLDLEAQLPGYDSTAVRYTSGCKTGGSSELWTIDGGSHIPAISESFSENVIDWLMARPKVRSTAANAAD